MEENPITHIPPPWTLHGDVYIFPFWTSFSSAAALPPQAHCPLEASSSFATTPLSKPVGGLGMVQLIRYRDSPVGPYDEMVLIPGYFEVTREGEGGRRTVERRARVTRIYVSREGACYNGRLNWNIPKHVADFTWTTNPDTSLTITVHTHTHTHTQTHPEPHSLIFQTTFHASRIPHPAIPFSFSPTLFSALGFPTTLVQPPLPRGDTPELVGTQRWRAVVPGMASRRCKVGWFDVRQEGEEGTVGEECEGEADAFWPGLGRWRIGVVLKDAEVTFGVPEEWDEPASSL